MTTFRLGRRGINLFESKKILFILWLFLLVFPKGGFKIADIPITWGYLLLGLMALVAFSQKSWEIQSPRLDALLCLLPFQIISFLTIWLNGSENIGWTVSFFISFFFLPFAFLFFFSKTIETIDLNYLLNLIKTGISIITYYGILSFIYKQTLGKYFEIPFLTVNWADLGMLDDYKCNSRGFVSKLISTYNNGQLFGISMMILLPLYTYIQKNPWHRFFTKAALILTFCRTIWIGLLLNEILYNIFAETNKIKSTTRVIVSLIALTSGIYLLLLYYGINIDFIFDPDLGGRRGYLENLKDWSLFSRTLFSSLPEIVYLGILNSFGMIGLFAYLLAMGGPLILYGRRKPSRLRLCLALGLVNHLFLSGSDGAVLFIPILAFYWLVVSLLARTDLDSVEILS